MPPLAKFAASPFGVVERLAEPGGVALMPVTVRRVEPALQVQALTPGQGQRHEARRPTRRSSRGSARSGATTATTPSTRKEAARDVKGALPQGDRQGRSRPHPDAHGLAARRPGRREDAGHAQGRGRRPAALRGDRHPAHAGLPRARDRIAEARRRAARRALRRRPHDVRAHHGAGHQPGGAFQAGPRERGGLGHDAGQGQGGGQRRRARVGLRRQGSGRGHAPTRAGSCSSPASRPNAPSCASRRRLQRRRLLRERPRQGRARRRGPRLHLERLAARHRALALQRADQHGGRSPTASPTPCSTARCCAPARRCR